MPANPPPLTPQQPRTRNYGELVVRDFLANRLALLGTIVIVFVMLVAVFCPLLANQRPLYIKAVFKGDYENSLLVILEQVGILAEESPDAIARAEALVLIRQNVVSIEEQLSPGDRATIRQLLSRIDSAVPVSGEIDTETLYSVLDALEPAFEFNLIPVSRYPAIRALATAEILAILTFFAVLLSVCLRRWLRGLLPRAGFVLVCVVIGTLVWRSYYPTIQDNRPYRRILESAEFLDGSGIAVRSPVPYGENENIIEDARQAPSWLIDGDVKYWHWLGTDTNGRDVLARMVYGARVSMLVGIVAVSIYTIIGIVVGAMAGFFRGWVDICISRLIEIVICFPPLILILSVQAFLAPSILNIILALAALWWTGVARLQRGEFLRLVNLDYVQAVRALGGSNTRIIFLHVLPNGLGPILVLVSFGIAGSILIESGLSFLGFGIPQPMASWGDLLNNGRNSIRDTWWLTVFPGFAIFLTVTCFNLIGEGVRDALDPMKER